MPSTHRQIELATTIPVVRCAWCQQRFARPERGGGQPQEYCSRLHQEWAWRVAREDYPLIDCPRCGRHDMRIAAPNWAICQTCGHQSDRPDLLAGTIAPRGISHGIDDIRDRLAPYLS